MAPPLKPEVTTDTKVPPTRQHWIRDPALSNAVIAGAALVNLLVSAGLFWATYRTATIAQQVFLAAHRPYVGISSLDLVPDTSKHTLTMTAVLKNYGTAPAEEFDSRYEPFLNGVREPTGGVPDKPSTLFPGQMTKLTGLMREPSYSQISEGTATLEIIFRVSYKGPGNKPYSYNEKQRYDRAVGAFMNLGPPEKE
ncbi:MAG TPA: hypothetical protein VM094_06525 [Gemmatimonadales bacterium]|nr:hypothetical protein [Gemmatimonadales bacterium]